MRVAIVSTYAPRRCGIATFAADLRGALLATDTVSAVDVIAIGDGQRGEDHEAVRVTVDQHRRSDYARAGRAAGRSGVDVVMIQHEYGIFGGRDGENLLSFASELTVPYAVLARLLAGTDLFVTAYREMQQAVSGALTFAVATGCPVISTPYRYARDLLTDHGGRFFDVDDANALATAMEELIEQPAQLERMRRSSRRLAARLAWPAVGAQIAAVLEHALMVAPHHGPRAGQDYSAASLQSDPPEKFAGSRRNSPAVSTSGGSSV